VSRPLVGYELVGTGLGGDQHVSTYDTFGSDLTPVSFDACVKECDTDLQCVAFNFEIDVVGAQAGSFAGKLGRCRTTCR
jgi:hypothetical protein